jgi:uncharacterized membrane protein YedE/YeeE
VEPKKPVFGTASVVFAALSVVLPVLIMLLFDREANQPTEHQRDQFWRWLGLLIAGLIVSTLAAGLSGLLGTIAGAVALLRGEPKRWRAVVGLVVNAPIVAFVAFLFFVVRANNG